MKTSITTFNNAPYFDDFSVPDMDRDNKDVMKKNYHRILFQPSYAIQTRELNQLQSMLQNQVGELGSGLVNEYHGGTVKEGQTEFVDNVRYVDIRMDNTMTIDVVNRFENITQLETRDPETGDVLLRAQVLAVRYLQANTYRVWHKYLNRSGDVVEFGKDDLLYLSDDRLDNDFTINIVDGTEPNQTDTLEEYQDTYHTLFAVGIVESENVGWGFSISVAEGIFLVKGTLVYAFPQREFFIKEEKDQSIMGYISFLIRETIVTAEEDNTLRDNALGSYNYAAPGADRYRIQLELAFNTDNDFLLNMNNHTSNIFNGEDENFLAPFINIRSIFQSGVQNVVAPLTLSESMDQHLATRTFDESGSYTVKPFTISIREIVKDGSNNGKFTTSQAKLEPELEELLGQPITDQNIDELKAYVAIDIDPATAYVRGYRISPENVTTVYLKKARTVSDDRTVGVTFLRGSYIDVVADEDFNAVDITSLLNDKIRAISYRGIVNSDSLEGQAGRGNWIIYRLHVYNNFAPLSDVPTGLHLRYLVESLAENDPIPVLDQEIKSPRRSISYFPIGFKGVKTVSAVRYSYLKTYQDQPVDSSRICTINLGTDVSSDAKSANDIIVVRNGKFLSSNDVIQDVKQTDDTLRIEFTESSGINTGECDFIIPLIHTGVVNRRTKTKIDIVNEEIHVNCQTGLAVLPHQDVILSTLRCAEEDCQTPLSHLVIDDGLGDNFYENPIIRFPSITNSDPNNGYGYTSVIVSYSYFSHDQNVGFFDRHSYNSDEIDFDQIPKQGDSRMSDFIDFRVKRQRVFNPTTSEISYAGLDDNPTFLRPNYNGDVIFKHYLPRIDTLSLSSDVFRGKPGRFEVILGSPSLSPVPRRVNSASMALYELEIPPYTYKTTDIKKRYIDNNRYTMSDIGRLEQRVENLEYYTSLSLLEKEAQNRKILDLTEEGGGFERFKNGILVDSFMNHNIGDIYNPDYSVAVNTHRQTMGPSFKTYNIRCKYSREYKIGTNSEYELIGVKPADIFGSVSTRKTPDTTTKVQAGFMGDEQLSLDTGEREVFVENLHASQTVSVQPYEVTIWTGHIKLSPSSDEWIDTDRLPDFAVDFSAFSNFFEDVSDILIDLWGTNETLLNRTLVGTAHSQSVDVRSQGHGTMTTTTNTTTRTFEDEILRDWLSSSVQEVDIDFGDRVVDVSVIPWIRSRDIHFRGVGFKPNTKLYLFFDGADVTEYTGSAEFQLFSVSDDVNVYNGQAPADWSESGIDGELVTDEFGTIEGVFRIPNNDDIRFRTGVRELVLTSSPTNNTLEADTVGTTTYNAMGLVQQKEFVGAAARVPQITRETETVFNQFNVSTSTQTQVYRDPIAQTFYVDPAQYGAGLFVTDVDLYFATKPQDPNVAITVYLVKCENGTPTRQVVPGSQVSLRSADVNVSGREPTDPSSPIDGILSNMTRFTFDFPVYLMSGEEYALIVFGDTPEFRVWTGVMGQSDITTHPPMPITKNPDFGVFLQSQNQRTWTPYQYRNLTMRLHKAVFGLSQVAFKFTTDIGGTNLTERDPLTFLQPFFKTLEPSQTNLDLNVRLFNANGTELTTSGSNVQQTAAAYIKSKLLSPGEELPFSFAITAAKYAEIEVRLATKNRNVSPVVDCETGSLYFRGNQVNNDITGEGAIYDSATRTWGEPTEMGGNALARYITKRVVLNNPSEDLRVIMAVHRPVEQAEIRVFAKRKPSSRFDSSIHNDTGWYEMQLYSVNGDTNTSVIPINRIGVSDFSDVEYILPFPDPNFVDAEEFQPDAYGVQKGFSEFMIKVVFLSSERAQVCKIKNLMAIASL